ncbi:hypothetical protein KIN20_026979 [Parelaphostrongylus tenuis]|uniref:Uncharacterized protein n=1 Tax=Parelaphostrongylus tenuis TaxID=148309 RepID=A0AAD5QYQ4_PARTN|nr:hypothetical protein KIN20_026979 [Parelaphostrongylus tenuis]
MAAGASFIPLSVKYQQLRVQLIYCSYKHGHPNVGARLRGRVYSRGLHSIDTDFFSVVACVVYKRYRRSDPVSIHIAYVEQSDLGR